MVPLSTREELVIGRYAEIALKGGNRRPFERALVRRVKDQLGERARVEVSGGRVLVHLVPGAALSDATLALCRSFGVVSAQPAVRLLRPVEMSEVASEVIALAQQAIQRGASSFKVAARRADKGFFLNSLELNRVLGAAVAEATGLRVDVHHSDLELEVDVRPDAVFLAGVRVAGPGGLPTGVSGRAVALLSGGIDSPVAAYLAAKRGLALSAVYFHTFPYTGEGARQKVYDLCRRLTVYAGPVRLWVVHFTEIQEAIAELVPEPMRTVVARRMMVRLAEEVARREHAGALITGDSLGQVASQTLEALSAIGEISTLPLLRPLVAWDKTEIVSLARRIDTYSVSIRPFDDCCVLFAPQHPRTRPTRAEAARAEERLDIKTLMASALRKSERLRATPGSLEPLTLQDVR